MSDDERARAALIRAAARIWGEEVAATLDEMLPPAGERPATKRDIEGVLAALDALDDRHEERLDGVDARFDRVDARFDGVDARFDRLEEWLEEWLGPRMDERHERVVDRVTAVFERRISDAVATQTRTLVFSQLSALVVIAALAFGLR